MQLLVHTYLMSFILGIFADIVGDFIHVNGLLPANTALLSFFKLAEELPDWRIDVKAITMFDAVFESTFVEGSVNIIQNSVSIEESVVEEACVAGCDQ